MTSTPAALLQASRLIRSEKGRTNPDYRISSERTTEPEQYRVSFTDPRTEAQDREFNLVLSLTITPEEFATWQAWLDGKSGGTP